MERKQSKKIKWRINKMKLVKTANGKKTIKMSKKEWTDLGKKAGWMDESQDDLPSDSPIDEDSNQNKLGEYEEYSEWKDEIIRSARQTGQYETHLRHILGMLVNYVPAPNLKDIMNLYWETKN